MKTGFSAVNIIYLLVQINMKTELWAVVRSPVDLPVAMFRDEGTARDFVDCHYSVGVVTVERVVVPEDRDPCPLCGEDRAHASQPRAGHRC